MLALKFVPSAEWGSRPFMGPQIVVLDESNRCGFWNGSSYAIAGGAEYVNGVPYLRVGDTLVPLTIMTGVLHEPLIAGVLNQVVQVDVGAADHTELLMRFNCNTGDPDAEDTALMSASFAAPDGNGEVIKTGITGPSGGILLPYSASEFTMLHIGLRGSGSYTQAAGNTVIVGQSVLLKWSSSLNVDAVTVNIASSTDINGLQVGAKGLRKLIVTGYSRQ